MKTLEHILILGMDFCGLIVSITITYFIVWFFYHNIKNANE